MRCLLCNYDGIEPTAEVCPNCKVLLATLMRDVLPHGTLLHGGKYQIDYALGRGGFGITYKARHVSLDQTIAIKEFYPQQAMRNGTTGELSVPAAVKGDFARALKKFVREGQTLARLEHPNVVRVRDHFEERGTAYLVMDMVTGRTLRDELDAQPRNRLEQKRVQKIIGQLVEALEVVHANGVYHLDIKPHNVLLTASERAVLVDFGAARQGFSSQSTQAYTLEYAAPEVLAGGDVGPESDLFELGMMLYEMLAGERPPTALSRLIKDTWEPVGIDAPWDQLVSSALRMKKEERPQSVGEWWEQGQAVTKAKPTLRKKRSANQEVESQTTSKQKTKAKTTPNQETEQEAGQRQEEERRRQEETERIIAQKRAARREQEEREERERRQREERERALAQEREREKKQDPVSPTPPAPKSNTGVFGTLFVIALICFGVYSLISTGFLTPSSSNRNTNIAITATPQYTPPPASNLNTNQWVPVIGANAPDVSNTNQNSPVVILGQPAQTSKTVTLHVQFLYVEPGSGGRSGYPGLEGATVSFRAAGKSFTARTDGNGWASFYKVPCGEQIGFTINYNGHTKDWAKESLSCEKSEVTWGSNVIVGWESR